MGEECRMTCVASFTSTLPADTHISPFWHCRSHRRHTNGSALDGCWVGLFAWPTPRLIHNGEIKCLTAVTDGLCWHILAYIYRHLYQRSSKWIVDPWSQDLVSLLSTTESWVHQSPYGCRYTVPIGWITIKSLIPSTPAYHPYSGVTHQLQWLARVGDCNPWRRLQRFIQRKCAYVWTRRITLKFCTRSFERVAHVFHSLHFQKKFFRVTVMHTWLKKKLHIRKPKPAFKKRKICLRLPIMNKGTVSLFVNKLNMQA